MNIKPLVLSGLGISILSLLMPVLAVAAQLDDSSVSSFQHYGSFTQSFPQGSTGVLNQITIESGRGDWFSGVQDCGPSDWYSWCGQFGPGSVHVYHCDNAVGACQNQETVYEDTYTWETLHRAEPWIEQGVKATYLFKNPVFLTRPDGYYRFVVQPSNTGLLMPFAGTLSGPQLFGGAPGETLMSAYYDDSIGASSVEYHAGASTYVGGNFGYDTANQEMLAVRFVPSNSGDISHISLNLEKVNTPTDDVVVRIAPDDNGQPSSATTLIATIPNSQIPSVTGGASNISVPISGVSVEANRSYWLILSRSGSLSQINFYASGDDSTRTSENTRRLESGQWIASAYTTGVFLEYSVAGSAVSSGSGTASVLVVAGGGGGGGGTTNGGVGGGGGAGGYQSTALTFATGSYPITVGDGGTAGDNTGLTPGGTGRDSSIASLLTSHGGGGGGTAIATVNNIAATDGGSGGGAGGASCHSSFLLNGKGILGEGNDGGHGGNTCVLDIGAGGGGAAEAGHNDVAYQASPGDGLGGTGLVNSLSGAATTYATGGNGGRTTAPGQSGAPNTGNGGNGNTGGPQGGSGGSGIVIISYPTGSMTATGGTITISGGKTIHTFTSNGVFTVGVPAFVPEQPILKDVCPDLLASVTNLVFITHGWNDEATTTGGWAQTMARSITSRLPDSSWGVCVYDWHEGAGTGLGIVGFETTAAVAYDNAWFEGSRVGQHLALRNFDTIHFIAHSAGGNVIQTAAENVKAISPQTDIHLTFLDPYDPSGGTRHYGLDPRNTDGHYAVYPDWWAEQYVDTRDDLGILRNTNLLLPDAFNADVSAIDRDPIIPLTLNLEEYLTHVHEWPRVWYASSTLLTDPPFSTYGFPLAIEGGATALPVHSLLPGALCVMSQSTDTCHFGPKSFSTYSVLNVFKLDIIQAQLDGVFRFSPSGNFQFINRFTIAQFPSSPVWFSVDATTTEQTNVLSFDYQFLPIEGSQDILTVFVDDKVVYNVDERSTDDALHSAKNIPVGDLPPGLHSVQFRLDPFTEAKSGIQISDIQLGLLTQTTTIDNTPPTTVAGVTGPGGANGWYVGTTTIVLAATDNKGGVGVQDTHYTLDSGPLMLYASTSPIVIAADGMHVLQFYSTDLLGNQEATNTLVVKIDKTPPEALIAFDFGSKKLKVTGIDAANTTVLTTATSSLITDEAGNALRILFSDFKQENGKVETKVISLNYNGVVKNLSDTRVKYEWELKSGLLSKLEEEARANNLRLNGDYQSANNMTSIEVKVNDSSTTVSLPGVVIVSLKTQNGVVTVQY